MLNIYTLYMVSVPTRPYLHVTALVYGRQAAVQTLKRHTVVHLCFIHYAPSPSWRAVQMISQAREVCNVSPSALVFSRLCECTIMFTPGPETPHFSNCEDCTSAQKSQRKLKNNINVEANIQVLSKNECATNVLLMHMTAQT